MDRCTFPFPQLSLSQTESLDARRLVFVCFQHGDERVGGTCENESSFLHLVLTPGMKDQE